MKGIIRAIENIGRYRGIGSDREYRGPEDY